MMADLKALVARTGLTRQLAGATAAGAVLQIVNRLLGLGSAVLLARVLGVDGYGAFVFAIALYGTLAIGVEFGLATLNLRQAARQRESSHEQALDYVTSSRRFILLASGIVGTAVASAIWVAPLVANDAMRITLTIALPLLALTPLVRLNGALLAGNGQLVWAQTTELFAAPFLLFVGVWAYHLSGIGRLGPTGALVIQFLSLFAAFLLSLAVLNRASMVPRGRRLPVSSLIAQSWPFFLIGSAMAVNVQIDILVIGILLGPDEVGIYRVAAQGASFATVGVTLLTVVAAPAMARLHHAGETQELARLYRLVRWVSFASVALALALFSVFGQQIIALLFGAEFEKALPVLLILCLGYLGNAWFGPTGTLLSMAGLERVTARVLWIVAGINLTGSVLAALIGGAQAVACVTAATLVAYHAALRHMQAKRLGF